MKFGETPLEDCEGAILAHSLRVGDTVLKKGSVLTAADLAALAAAGYARVTVARLEPGDLDENAAAARLAEAAAGPGVRLSQAATGRVNLYAERRGLALIDGARVDRINLMNEALTIATVPPFTLLATGQMLATVKVITFGLPGAMVEAAAALARDGGPLTRLAALGAKRVGLVQTRLPGIKESVLDKTVETTRARLAALGSELVAERRCPHTEAEVAAALAALRQAGCDILLVLGASAITDRRDVVPSAIAAAGGRVDHFGMPVDPGNLMLLARLDQTPVLGLPGSGRSPRLHGFDWVLQRLAADLPVTGRDLMAMGVGGLLKDIPTRPLPRAEAARPAAAKPPARAPRVAALVLAAGRSRRMGPLNKLLAEVDGVPMIARVVDAVAESKAGPVIVVTGHEAERVRACLEGRAVTLVHNPDYRAGLSTTLRAGIAALLQDIDGVLVCLGDMPRVTAGHIDRLIAAFDPAEGRGICVPTYDGKRGNPVLWDLRHVAEMTELAGDVGARHLIGLHAEEVFEVEMADDGVLVDVDSPDALTALKGRRTKA